jgi:excisionase family DNA binding protein
MPATTVATIIELEPLALAPRAAASFLGINKRTLSRLISAGKIVARKNGPRTLVDVASLKDYYEALPLKANPGPVVFGRALGPKSDA